MDVRGEATTTFVHNIDYNAKGQRRLIEYGNGARTTYQYEPETFRLVIADRRAIKPVARPDVHLRPGRQHHPNSRCRPADDLLNPGGRPHNDYTYDAIYRLITAPGANISGRLLNQS